MKQKKKMQNLILSAATVCTMLTGCSSETEQNSVTADSSGNVVTEVKERGLKFTIPQEYLDKGMEIDTYNENTKGYLRQTITYYSPTYETLFDELLDMSEEERTVEVSNEYTQKLWNTSRTLMDITLVETEEYNASVASGKTADDFSYYTPAEVLGENDGYTYLICIPELDQGDLTDEEWKTYKECREYMSAVKENISFISVELESYETDIGETLPAFTSQDLSGNEVTNDIFSEAELTVVNVWGTFCNPCIEEMPELEEWSQELPENVQIIGIIGDVEGKEDTEHLTLAQEIADKAGVSFVNIILSEDLQEWIKGIVGYPTTFFVDSEGNIVGDPVVGDDMDAYKAFVEEYING